MAQILQPDPVLNIILRKLTRLANHGQAERHIGLLVVGTIVVADENFIWIIIYWYTHH